MQQMEGADAAMCTTAVVRPLDGGPLAAGSDAGATAPVDARGGDVPRRIRAVGASAAAAASRDGMPGRGTLRGGGGVEREMRRRWVCTGRG